VITHEPGGHDDDDDDVPDYWDGTAPPSGYFIHLH
jgi:hypothetical protein